MNTDRVVDVGQALLDSVTDRLVLAGIEVPERRLLVAGLPAFDCEQLTVHLQTTGTVQGDPNASLQTAVGPHAAFAMRAWQFVVSLVRCVYVPDDPENINDAALQADGERSMRDAHCLPLAVVEARDLGMIAGCRNVIVGDVVVEEPSGGMIGITMSVAIAP